MIVLPKKVDASIVDNYHPISLIHSFSKLFMKVLASRLAPKLHELVAYNQSAFVKGRVIHDNFKAVQLSTKSLHRSKTPSALIKVDIAKAFDTVDWTFLLAILKHMGFSRRWLDWISLMLSTASTKVVVNGSPGRRICHARGLRQGDPLSPMLIVLVMEALSAILHRADSEGLFRSLGHCRVQERVFFYADDMVIFLTPLPQDLVLASTILDIFGNTSGLRVNPDKCTISPIQCGLDDSVTLLQHFPGKLTSFPCKYLGIPLAIRKLKKTELQPLVDRVSQGLPTWKAGMMSRAGRALLVKVKMSVVPVHTAIALTISPWAIKCIDKRQRAFLWRGTESVAGGQCLVT
jgi:hypothetical protein